MTNKSVPRVWLGICPFSATSVKMMNKDKHVHRHQNEFNEKDVLPTTGCRPKGGTGFENSAVASGQAKGPRKAPLLVGKLKGQEKRRC